MSKIKKNHFNDIDKRHLDSNNIVYRRVFLNPYKKLPVNGKVGINLYTWGHLVKNNKYAFRERDFDTPKPKGMYRVAVVGDSLTYGAGLAVEERYTAVAEQLLTQFFKNKKIEVLNFGFSGAATIVERDAVTTQDFKKMVMPDLMVIGFCLNDPQPRSQGYSVEREYLRITAISYHIIRKIAEGMQRIGLPYLSQLLDGLYFSLAEKLGIIPSWQTALQRTYEVDSPEWRQFIQALKDIKSVSDELGLHPPIFAVLNQGTFTDRPTDYSNPDKHLQQYLKWYHQAEMAAKQIGFTTYNHEDEIAAQLRHEPLSVNILDGHPSANLNRVYGRKLHENIKEIISQDMAKADSP